MADLRINRPEGVMTVHGLASIEGGSLVLRFRVHEGGVGQDWTGWTTDYAQITTPDGKTNLMSLTVTFEADGWVRVEGNLAQSTETLVQSKTHPQGRPALLTVRVKDPDTWPIYLIAPSHITIRNMPGAAT